MTYQIELLIDETETATVTASRLETALNLIRGHQWVDAQAWVTESLECLIPIWTHLGEVTRDDSNPTGLRLTQ